jgi:hypothetical protein
VAPDGTLTGDKLVENTETNTHFAREAVSGLADDTSYTFSVYAKASGRDVIALVVRTKANGFPVGYFNLATGTLGSKNTSGTSTITNVGNGWYRCSVTQNIGSGATNPEFFLLTCPSDGVQNYTGNGFSGIFIWGAQLEAGAFATSYIATVATTITRTVDSAVMTGTNFSSWFNNAEGTVYCEGSTFESTVGGFPRIFSISDGSNTNTMQLSRNINSGQARPSVVAGGVVQYAADIGAWTLGTSAKLAFAYKIDDFAATINSGTVSLDTVGTIPVVNQLKIGQQAVGGSVFNGTISKIAYWPERVTNAQLQTLTKS